MKKLVFLALTGLLAACSDTAGPVPVADVEIMQNAVAVDERTLAVGQTVQLTASVLDADGSALTDREVVWKSSASTVATVSETGFVTALAVGQTTITATAGGVSDQVLITVSAPPGSSLVCEDADAGLALSVGEVFTTSATGSPIICLAGGSAGSEYVLVPFNAAEAANVLAVEVAGSGLIGATGPPSPARMSRIAAGAGLSVPALREDVGFHFRLHENARRDLSGLARGGGSLAPLYSSSAAETAAALPAVGELIRYNVNSAVACSEPKYRYAEVMAISDRAIVVADTMNPSGGFTTAEYGHFAETFDTLVYPAVTSNFGVPADVDNNDRSVILYTSAVNELTAAGSSSYVGGFFFPRDLFPTVANDSMGACPTSNQAEMFYMLVPDPTGEINGNTRSKDFVAERTVGTLAHEFQHLINASRRLFIVDAGDNWYEQTWLNEGMSHIAEELTFYAATPHEPEQNIDVDDLRASTETFNRFVQYQWSNFGRYIEYMKTPRSQSLMGIDQDDDLQTRGATWAFLRYMADRHTSTGPALWKSLVDSNKTGLANLNAVLAGDALSWMRDWTVSVYTDDVVPVGPLYQQPSWDFRSIILGLKNGAGTPLYSTYPLEVVPLLDGASNESTMTLEGGGAGFLRFGIAAGGRAALRATSGGVAAPSQLKISIVRTK